VFGATGGEKHAAKFGCKCGVSSPNLETDIQMITANGSTANRWKRPWPIASPLLTVMSLFALALIVRLAVRVTFGEQYFWSNSYKLYYDLAANLVNGNGLCCRRPPLYPLFLAISVTAGKSFWLIVVPQALLGAGTAVCAFLIGREIFNVRAGLLACAITASYPYYVMHDTALQETGMLTFCTALSCWLLLRAHRLNKNFDWFLAGLFLGTIGLVRESAVPLVAAALFWSAIWGTSGSAGEKLRKSAILGVTALMVLSPWLIRNYQVTGRAEISSGTGFALWVGNNPDTFSHYPSGSIDRSEDQAEQNLSAADRAELARLHGNNAGRSDWFMRRALEFMVAHPALVVKNGIRKVAAGFSWRLNPPHGRLAEVAYFVGYVPVALLGILGMILARDKAATMLVAMLFLAFIVVTAIFWAHTSHRSYLDIYWIVFTAAVLDQIWTWMTRPQPVELGA
jgi:4-amino-4-deoxy-L-arabinose transferase-like glycosyltransferase